MANNNEACFGKLSDLPNCTGQHIYEKMWADILPLPGNPFEKYREILHILHHLKLAGFTTEDDTYCDVTENSSHYYLRLTAQEKYDVAQFENWLDLNSNIRFKQAYDKFNYEA